MALSRVGEGKSARWLARRAAGKQTDESLIRGFKQAATSSVPSAAGETRSVPHMDTHKQTCLALQQEAGDVGGPQRRLQPLHSMPAIQLPQLGKTRQQTRQKSAPTFQQEEGDAEGLQLRLQLLQAPHHEAKLAGASTQELSHLWSRKGQAEGWGCVACNW